MYFCTGKREAFNDTVLHQETDEYFDYDLEDKRDRRAIDEEDDEDFLQELNLLTRHMRDEYAQTRYESNNGRISQYSKKRVDLLLLSSYCYFRSFAHDNSTRIDDDDEEDSLVVDYLGQQVSDYSLDDFDLTLDKVIKGRLNVDDVIKRHRRVRRSVTKKDTIEHVTKIMESIEEELDDLKVTAAKTPSDRPWRSLCASPNKNVQFRRQQTQARHSSEVAKTPKCLVLPEGGVNCTDAVYHDPNEWRISRREIEKEIRKMREQLESLKVSLAKIISYSHFQSHRTKTAAARTPEP